MTTDWSAWIGNTEELHDAVDAAPLRLMCATLDRVLSPGSALPPLWHWLYFLPAAPRSQIGADGHPRRGGFLPPLPLPRRMWAGGRLAFGAPLYPGQAIRRVSRIADISARSGRSGELVFVKVVHDVLRGTEVAVREEQDIVFREAPQPGAVQPAPRAAPDDHDYARVFEPDPVLLFRYSALTFNGHRIHYDQPYATQREGYPALVVHGPLVATLLLEQLQRERPDLRIASFDFRALSPLFDGAPFWLCGKVQGGTAQLWARGAQGELAMEATAHVAAEGGSSQ